MMESFLNKLLGEKKEKLYCKAALYKYRRLCNTAGSVSLSGKNS